MKTEKKCFKCQETKPLSGFYKHGQMKDGYLNKCISCAKKDVSTHRKSNLEKVRLYDRKKGGTPARILNTKEFNKKYRQAFPERYAAHSAVGNAIRDGKLYRKESCEACGIPCTTHAHHWSYEREHWLDVEWLCPVCHKELHKAQGFK